MKEDKQKHMDSFEDMDALVGNIGAILQKLNDVMRANHQELEKQYQLQEKCFDNQDKRSYEHDETLQMALHELKIIRAKVDPNSAASGAKSTAWTPDVPSIIFGALIGFFVAFIL